MRKIAWIAGMTAVVAAGLVFVSPVSAHAESVIPAGVYVGTLNLEGMTEKEAENAVIDYVNAKLAQTVTLDVNGVQTVTSAEEIGLDWANPEVVDEILEEAKVEGNLLRRYMKKRDLQENPVRAEIDLKMDEDKLSAFVNEKCSSAVAEAKDAAITKNENGFVVTPSVTGIAVDMDATEKAINEALNTEGSGAVSVTAVITETEPKIKTEDLETIQDELGSFTTSFSSSGVARSTNLEVGTSKINGRVLMPGEVLSGYECMAPLTLDNGYKMATAYENGRSVDSVAGGVCQISTTLYNAALYAELDIVQRQNHSMTVAYVDHSRDAAIAGTYKDLKISNPYDTPIYIEGYTSNKKLTFKIYGKETRPANREVQFESKTLQWIDPGDPIEQPDASLQPGARVRVQSAHTGVRSELYKCVYVDGQLTERTLLNKDSYNSSKAIYRVGPALPAETVPVETTPAETAPVETAPQETAPVGPGSVITPTEAPAGPGAEASVETSISPLGPGGTQGP